LKIAFLTPEYPHLRTGGSGGIGSSIKNLAKGLVKKGIHVRILVYAQPKDSCFEEDGIQIQTIKNIKFKGLSRYLTQKKIELLINQLYQNKDIDLVEAADWTGFTSFINTKKCPNIIRLHGSDTYFCHLDKRPVKWINKFHEKRALQRANGHISVSQFTANVTNQLFRQNFHYSIISNCIDTDAFVPSIIAHENEHPLILYLGTIIRKKGVLEIPFIFNEIINKLPQCKLLLIGKDAADIATGNSSTWEVMKNEFSPEALNNTEYKGAVSYERVKEHLEQADVCIFPSFAEAFPVSWLEAMAMEKAIVTSNIGWANELIENEKDGLMEDPKNHQIFAQKIVQLISNKEFRMQIGKQARIKIKEGFSTDVIAQRNIEFYKKYDNNLSP